MIPQELRLFFWDVNPDSFDPFSHREYTIARVLEYGDDKAVAWLRANFSKAEITQVIRNERRLTRKSANFWALVYGIPADEVAALRQNR